MFHNLRVARMKLKLLEIKNRKLLLVQLVHVSWYKILLSFLCGGHACHLEDSYWIMLIAVIQ